jgi:hypothetical protein
MFLKKVGATVLSLSGPQEGSLTYRHVYYPDLQVHSDKICEISVAFSFPTRRKAYYDQSSEFMSPLNVRWTLFPYATPINLYSSAPVASRLIPLAWLDQIVYYISQTGH